MTFTEIRQIIAAATPGPWRAEKQGHRLNIIGMVKPDVLDSVAEAHYSAADQTLIAASRQLLPLLLDVAEAAPDCICGMACGDPRISDHSSDCKRLRQALAKLKELKL